MRRLVRLRLLGILGLHTRLVEHGTSELTLGRTRGARPVGRSDDGRSLRLCGRVVAHHAGAHAPETLRVLHLLVLRLWLLRLLWLRRLVRLGLICLWILRLLSLLHERSELLCILHIETL